MSLAAGDLRALAAAALREWREIRRYPTHFLGAVYWPVLFPAVYVLMGRVFSGQEPAALAAFARRSGVEDVAGFIFVGTSMWIWLSFMLWGPGTALRREQVRGTLEAFYMTPASRLVVLFGPPLGHLSYAFVSFAAAGVGMRLLFGVAPPPDAALRALVVVALAIPAMHAISALFAAAVIQYGEVNPLVHLVRGVLTLAAGITFPVAMLPGWAQSASGLLPPTYVVADVRRVLLAGASLSDIAGDLAKVVALTALAAAGALVVYAWSYSRARRSGMIGRY